MHNYYENQGIWNIQAKQVSWVVQMTLKVAAYFQDHGLNEEIVRSMPKYSIGKMYKQLLGAGEKVH